MDSLRSNWNPAGPTHGYFNARNESRCLRRIFNPTTASTPNPARTPVAGSGTAEGDDQLESTLPERVVEESVD